MNIALVHDYLAQDGGAERVLKAFHELWPKAPIFVLFHDAKKITEFDQKRIRQSFLSKFPFVNSHYQWYLPLMPKATEAHVFKNFDVILSSTSAFAKGITKDQNTLHISYCHTPPRYLWSDAQRYVSDLPYNPLIKIALPKLFSRLRQWDLGSIKRVDHFIANSKTVQERIQKYYGRGSSVIHPPVEIKLCPIDQSVQDYFVAGGRLVPYKRLDIVINAFNRLRWPLKIFGDGPELASLKAIAKPNIEFLGRISDTQKAYLLSSAKAFIHPQLEDFGITPVEAMASGRPVLAYNVGGATETVVPGVTGSFFQEQNWESLVHELLNFNWQAWDRQKIREHATNFGADNFKDAIQNFVQDRYDEFKKGLSQEKMNFTSSVLSAVHS